MKVGLQAYLQGSLAAVAFYQRAFGATLGYHEFHPDGTYLHAELYVDGELLLALSESNNRIASESRMACSGTSQCSALPVERTGISRWMFDIGPKKPSRSFAK